MKTRFQRWFMPWRWSRWVWALLFPLALLSYFLSAVPVLRLAHQQMPLGPESLRYVKLAYRPIWTIDRYSDAAAATIDWEDSVMDRLLGLEGGWGSTNPGGPFWMSHSTIKIQRLLNGSPRETLKPEPNDPPDSLPYFQFDIEDAPAATREFPPR